MTGRIVWTLLIEVIVFVVTIVLAMIDTSLYPGVFFYITMGSIVTLNSECKLLLQSCRLFATSLSYLAIKAICRIITQCSLQSQMACTKALSSD